MNEWPLPSQLPDPNALVPEPADAPPEPYPFWGYADIVVFLGVSFAALLAVLLVGALLAPLVARAASASPVLVLVLTQAFVYGIGILGLYAVIAVRYRRPLWDSLRWTGTRSAIRNSALAGVATAIAGSLLAMLVGAQDLDDMPMKAMLASRASVAVVGLLAVTLGPIFEELTFRGFLLPLFAKTLGSPAAIAVCAGAFALIHGPQYGWAWQALLPVGFAGACFGVARVASGSTGVAAVMHAIYNLTIFSAFLAQGGADNLPW